MNNFIHHASLMCLSLGTLFSLEAGQPTSTPSQHMQPAKENSSQENPEMASWMIETGQVAKDYVEGIDKGQYPQSWTKGDQLFQKTISQEEWSKGLTLNRKKLGKVKSRVLKIHAPSWDPQGLPKGPYMVVEFDTSFENAPNKVEILTLRRGADKKWRILTYQIN